MLFCLPQVPTSTCSVKCTPGFRKFHQKETADCCFDCVWCPENEVSNETGMYLCAEEIAEIEYLFFSKLESSWKETEDIKYVILI